MSRGPKRLLAMLASLTLVSFFGPVRAQTGPVAKAAGASNQLVVSLRPAVVVSLPQVSIHDVAVCEGGSAVLREQIGRLDLAELAPDGQAFSITQEQIYYRICLSGVDPKLFRLRGPASVSVKFPRYRVTEEDALAAAKKAVLELLPEPAKDVAIKLAEPVRGLMVLPATREQVHCEGEVPAGASPLGKVRVEVTVLVNGQKQGSVFVNLEVRARQQVMVCKQRIEPGEALTMDKFQLERRVIDTFKEYVTSIQGLQGKRARNALAVGQLLTSADVEAAPAETPIVVRQQALVKLVAKLGSFQLVAIGEALQDGRTGQLIRVRNIDSQSVVVGRVVDRSVVEVEY